MKYFYLTSALIAVLSFCTLNAQDISHITTGSTWKYNTGADLGTTWKDPGYNDASWSQGAAQLGYGDGDETTLIPSGVSPNFYPTYYFRKTFSATTASLADLKLRVRRDDGIVVYLNGTEAYRDNMPAGTPAYITWAATACADDGGTWLSATLPVSLLLTGTNTIAVEIHQSGGASTDVSFDLELISQPKTIFALGSAWKYSTGSDLGTSWKTTAYSDATWASGNAELGYGDGDETTTIPSGPVLGYYPTYYFRKTFSVTDITSYLGYNINLKRDDGIIVYLNGTEVYRNNMPSGTPTYSTWASAACSDDGTSWFTSSVLSSLMVSGTNVIAVEVHQSSVTSTDVSFNLELTGANSTVSLTRGPYLQVGTASGIIVRWRTDVSTSSKVAFGLSAGSLTQNVTDNTLTTEHIVQLSGLSANTKYFYSIGSTTETLQGDADNFFFTSPVTGTEKVTRIWATGDCGSGATQQVNVRNAYQNFVGSNYTDAWLLMGDNAYNGGFDNEFQSGFFQPYMQGKLMRQTVIWPAPGNHDYDNNSALLASRTTPYYQSFTMPTTGQAGGISSGTEAYYSYNIGNIHFISLDSYGTENAKKLYDTTGAQALWLKQDLAANTQKWTIAYWHHPPYTKGSHDSDLEGELINMRTNLIRVMDRYKVDLILCGHSHDYERSKIMKGHYGNESSFSSAFNASTSSGMYNGSANSCPYIKSSSNPVNEGIIYVVAGSAGKLSGTSAGYPHNAMYYSNSSVSGSLYLEVNANRLDAKFISESGGILDSFTVMKDVNKNTVQTINSGQSITMNASWKGKYLWNPTGSTAVSLTQSPVCSSVYYVADGNLNCLHDTVNVTVSGSNPVAQFSSPSNICAGSAVTFTDQSTNLPTSWSWTFPGGTPATSTAQNPSVTFSASGTKLISLTVSNCYGNNGASQNINVNPVLTPSVSIAITAGSQSICPGTSVTFTATPTNGGSAPNYNFRVNGVTVQNGTSATYTSTTLANTNTVSCILTSNALCASPTTATSNSISMTVNQVVAPGVSIAITGGAQTICPGAAVTFTATPTNGGSAPNYNFRINGITIQNGSAATFMSNALANNDAVSCVMTSNLACASPVSATSNTIFMTVNSPSTPTVSIAITGGGQTICSGTAVTFTATLTNGGTTPGYNFRVNGQSVQNGTSATYTSSTLANADAVTCVMTSNALCANPASVTSNSINMTVNPPVSPSVNISITGGSQTICQGTSVTFTAVPTNGGSTPIYNFKINGVSVQSGAATTYTSTTLANNEVVSCLMTSNAACVSPISATSNSIAMTVNSVIAPSVSIAITSGAQTICQGTSVTFTATPTNGGSTPNYNFKVSGVSVQSGTAPAYTSSALANSNTVSCVMTSNAACVNPVNATSNSISMTVNPILNAAVSLAITTGAQSICPATPVTFTATPVNGGSTPNYNFKLNGLSVQNSVSAVYTNSTLVNADAITCVMTSNALCVNPVNSNSNNITMIVNPPVTPMVSIAITAGTQTICTGTSVTFTATPTNGGNAPLYNFKINGISTQSGPGATFTSAALANNDAVTCVMTSNANCSSPAAANSNSIVMAVAKPNWYRDSDLDTYGDPLATISQCTQPVGYVANNLDCNDNNGAVHPSAVEICNNAIDDNCNNLTDEGCSAMSISGIVSPTCGATASGAVNITVSNGVAGYSFSWSNGAITEDISGLAAGTYSVTVTDITSATTSASFTVLTVSSTIPSRPGNISGEIAICPDNTYAYSISAVANASSYVWIVPANSTLISGQGTTSISIAFNASYVTGSISVQAASCGGISSAKTLTVKKIAVPSNPGNISGSATVCTGDIKSYSIAAVARATGYIWTAPPNSVLISGQGTTSVSIQFLIRYSTGNVSVIATNCSGNSGAKTFAVKFGLSTPGSISGSNSVCPGVTTTYSVSAVTNATNYIWNVPSDWNILTGQGTRTISVQVGATGGAVSVAAGSVCGTTVPSSKTVSIAACKNGESQVSIEESEITESKEQVFSSFNIYPNPAEDYVNLAFCPLKGGLITVDLYDLNGKLLRHVFNGFSEPGISVQENVNTKYLESGIYTFQIRCNQAILNKKLIITR